MFATDWMRPFLVLGLSALILAGCVSTRESYTGLSNAGKRAYLAYAAKEGPVLVRAVSSPLGYDQRTAEAIADAADGAVFGSTAKFTADRSKAPAPGFRVVVLFNPPDAVTPGAVCANPNSAPIAKGPKDKLAFLAVFCALSEPLSGVHAVGPMPKDLEDPNFRAIVRAAFSDLFPHNDPDHDGNPDTIILTSLQVFPSIQFTLNPLQGMFR